MCVCVSVCVCVCVCVCVEGKKVWPKKASPNLRQRWQKRQIKSASQTVDAPTQSSLNLSTHPSRRSIDREGLEALFFTTTTRIPHQCRGVLIPFGAWFGTGNAAVCGYLKAIEFSARRRIMRYRIGNAKLSRPFRHGLGVLGRASGPVERLMKIVMEVNLVARRVWMRHWMWKLLCRVLCAVRAKHSHTQRTNSIDRSILIQDKCFITEPDGLGKGSGPA